MSCGTRCVPACPRCECRAERRSPRHRPISFRRSSVSAVPVFLGAPAAPRWLPAAAANFADAPAADILAWAVETFGSGLTVACSMQDGVLVDLAVRADPDVEVVFLDTGFHFGETLTTARRMQARYDLNLVTLAPAEGAATYDADGTEACCGARKVAPLERHLAARSAWVTGLRRAESPTRAGAAAVEWDAGRGIVKVNPIVGWSDDDVARHRRPRRHCESLAGQGVRLDRLRALHAAGLGSRRAVGRQRAARVRPPSRQPGRVRAMAFAFPVALEVAGRRCVVFGSGPAARARAAALTDAGAAVDVIDRPHEDGDLAGAFLAVAATGDAAETARIFAEAER